MIRVEKLRGWLPRVGRSQRARVFADAAFPRCAGHRAEALATFQVLERLSGRCLEHLDLDAPLSELLPDRSALEALTLEQVQEVVLALEEEYGVSAHARHTELKEDIWATTVCHVLLGPAAQATNWGARTIWERSPRGIINQRVRAGGDCSCGEPESRRTTDRT